MWQVQSLQGNRRQVVFGLSVVGLLIMILGIIKYSQIARAIEEHKNFKLPPEAVTSFIVSEVDWARTYEAVGSLSPLNGVILSAEESGRVAKINVESGATVNAGDVLIELDTSVEQAQLAGAKAKLDLASQNLERIRALVPNRAMSKADLDNAQAEYRATEAQVAQLKAQIDRRKITAPFGGRAGIRKVNLGQFVPAGTEVLPLYALDRLYADFSLQQQAIKELAPGQKVEITSDFAQHSVYDAEITAVNPQIDPDSRMVGVRALVTNRQDELRPGMFVRARVILPQSDRLLAIPISSVSFAPYGDSVYVIEAVQPDSPKAPRAVRQQVVQLGARRGDQVAIVTGLKAGEEVVSSGVFKLHPGSTVMVNNSTAPAADPAPHPADT